MTFYENVLRDLFQGFRFYATDPGTKEKVYISFEEIIHRQGLYGQMALFSAHYLNGLGFSENLGEAMCRLGVYVKPSEDAMAGFEAVVGESSVPISLSLALSSHALFAQMGSAYENDAPPPGSEVDITGLFVDAPQLINAYMNDLRSIHLMPEAVKERIKMLAAKGDPAAMLLLEKIIQNEPEFAQAPEAKPYTPEVNTTVAAPEPATPEDNGPDAGSEVPGNDPGASNNR